MTATTGMAQHPDVSEISDLTEGLLSPSRSDEVRRHLDGCQLCSDVHESLEEIRGLLGTLPGPPKMPADLAGRIDAALAAEALLDAAALDDAAHVSRETTPSAVGTPEAPASKEPLTGEGGRDRPPGRPGASHGPGRTRLVRRRRGALIGAFLGMAAVGTSVLLGSLLASSGKSSDSGDAASSRSSAQNSTQKGVDSEFSQERLQGRVNALLTSGAVVPEPMAKGSSDSPSDRSGTSAPRMLQDAAPSCVRRGTGRTEAVLAVAQGSYEGHHAYLLVLPGTSDLTQVWAYVVDASCVTEAPSGTGKVLLTRSYPRP